MTNAFLITDDDIIICDPEAEYFSLVQRLGGQVIRLSPAGKGMDGKPQYVNPMDINLNYSEDDNPLALKSDFILSLCELVIGGKEGLQPVDKTVIDRAVRNVYRDYLADPDPAKMPILGDLYDELLNSRSRKLPALQRHWSCMFPAVLTYSTTERMWSFLTALSALILSSLGSSSKS